VAARGKYGVSCFRGAFKARPAMKEETLAHRSIVILARMRVRRAAKAALGASVVAAPPAAARTVTCAE